jgi:prepilin-type N-terminal cleavage/methylation domain-containing protein
MQKPQAHSILFLFRIFWVTHFTYNKQQRFNYRSGFTVVELLVGIVIISLLATLSLVSYTGISNRAKEASVIADLTNAAMSTSTFPGHQFST